MYYNLEYRITTKDYNKAKSQMRQKISRLIFIEMSIDALFSLMASEGGVSPFLPMRLSGGEGLSGKYNRGV